ncbi:hypothetical protein FRC12_005507 [Ceratobasidium sp. 428]|nr:hypothetical protein FRC12_005507 [Ceratobasidium sp. 428]
MDVVSVVKYSPDGRYIASGSFDGTIIIWDASTGQPMGRPLRGHAHWINSVSFSPDGKRLAACSAGRTIRVWDISSIPQKGLRADGESAVTPSIYGPLESGSGNSQGSTVSLVPDDCELDKYGWLIDPKRRRVIWLPDRMRNLVLDPRNLFVISSGEQPNLDLHGIRLGENWHQCFDPEKQDENVET